MRIKTEPGKRLTHYVALRQRNTFKNQLLIAAAAFSCSAWPHRSLMRQFLAQYAMPCRCQHCAEDIFGVLVVNIGITLEPARFRHTSGTPCHEAPPISAATQGGTIKYPVTPDGRYFIVRGRLWRMSDPALPEATKQRLTSELMAARRAVAAAQRTKDDDALAAARAAVQAAKVGLGERGPVWWNDGTPDYNRHMAKNTPYADWHKGLEE